MLRKLKHLFIAAVAIPCLYAMPASAGLMTYSGFSDPSATITDGAYTSDGSLTSDIISVSTQGIIEDVTVSVNIEHDWIGDLVIMLAGPDSTLITLMSRPGMDETQQSCCGAFDPNSTDISLTFTDEATTAAEDWNTAEESYTPDDLLDVFDGSLMEGEWTLYVGDGFSFHNAIFDGTLVNWTLNITYQEVPLPSSILLMGLGLLALRVAKRR